VTDIEETPPDWVLREAAKRSELSNDTPRQRAILFDTNPSFRALCRAIEQHEAYKQKVSDAVTAHWMNAPEPFERFILRDPASDPLAQLLEEIRGEGGFDSYNHYAHRLRAALEARGLEIKEISK
jgi:hypothetical protein